MFLRHQLQTSGVWSQTGHGAASQQRFDLQHFLRLRRGGGALDGAARPGVEGGVLRRGGEGPHHAADACRPALRSLSHVEDTPPLPHGRWYLHRGCQQPSAYAVQQAATCACNCEHQPSMHMPSGRKSPFRRGLRRQQTGKLSHGTAATTAAASNSSSSSIPLTCHRSRGCSGVHHGIRMCFHLEAPGKVATLSRCVRLFVLCSLPRSHAGLRSNAVLRYHAVLRLFVLCSLPRSHAGLGCSCCVRCVWIIGDGSDGESRRGSV